MSLLLSKVSYLAKLVTSEAPVLVCAPPAADSVHTAGHRLFANGKIDRQGPARQKASAAATRRKIDTSSRRTGKAPPSHTSLISLTDSDDDSGNNDISDVNASPVKVINAHKDVVIPPPSRKFTVVNRPKDQKKEKKQEVISLVSSDTQSPSGNLIPTGEEKDDSDYEDHVVSRKRKAKSEATSRASKKKVPSSEVKAAQPKGVHGSKGKAPMRSLPLNDDSSSDDETLQEPTEQGLFFPSFSTTTGVLLTHFTVPLQTAKCLRDDPPQVGNKLVVKGISFDYNRHSSDMFYSPTATCQASS